mmetsp:Transcript_12901/g.26238  ORF Transcript_12901/g.26238 Transcript_12901/m.26238 type:complete len:112 (-) Transcript_12901:226-561(-)
MTTATRNGNDLNNLTTMPTSTKTPFASDALISNTWILSYGIMPAASSAGRNGSLFGRMSGRRITVILIRGCFRRLFGRRHDDYDDDDDDGYNIYPCVHVHVHVLLSLFYVL